MWRLIKADLRANVDHTRRTGLNYWLRVIGKLVVTPQVQAVLLFRVSTVCRGPLRPLAYVLRAFNVVWAGVEIHPNAHIGPGLALVHSTGVVIGPGVVIGSDCRINHGATLGEPGRGSAPERWGFPTVGDGVTIGTHAVILDPCHVGDGVAIAANAVVTKDVPASAVVAGVPARVVGQTWVDNRRSSGM